MAEILTELVARISADTSALKIGLSEAEGAAQKTSKSIQQSFKDIGTSMTNVGKQMSLKLTAPIVGLGAVAFKMAGDFDQSFRKVNVMLGASTEEAKEYKKRILEISSATGKSATEVADAFYTIVSAGHRGADSLDILEAAVRGATGGAADAMSTTEALTKAMNVFELEGVKGSSKAMDVFFGIVDSGLLSFEEMSNSFPRAASNAAGLGVSIEETGATLATLTKVLGSTEQAATATDAVFRLMISPSEAMVGLFERWGVKSGPEAIKKFGGLTGVLAKLKDATGGEVTAIRELFASDEAMRGILPLLTSSYNDYGQAVDTVTNSQGRANEAFDEMAQGPGFQLKQTFTQIKNAGIKLGDTLASTLTPILKTLGEKVEGLIQWWQSLDERWQKIIIIALGILAVVGPMLIIFGQIAMAISFLIPVVSALAVAIMGVTWPVLAVIAGIAALIAIGILVWKNWDTISEKAKEIWGAITDFLKDTLDKIVGFFKEHWDKILAILFPAVGIPILIARNWRPLLDFFSDLWGEITAEIKQWIGNIKNFLTNLNPWDWIKEKWEDLLAGIKGILGKIFGRSIVEDWAQNLAKYLGNVDLETPAQKMFGGITDAATSELSKTIDTVKGTLEGLKARVGLATTSEERGRAILAFQRERISAANLLAAETGITVLQAQAQLGAPVPAYMLQRGGIVTQPTLAMIGEAGAEAVVPLNEAGDIGGITINFTQPVFFDREDTMNRFVDLIRKGIQRQDRLRFGGAFSG